MNKPDFTKPLSNAKREKEAQVYAKSYDCSIEIARRDVYDEHHWVETEHDAFIERCETYFPVY